MAKKVRIATFNVENLFARYKFNKKVDPINAVKEGWDVNETLFTLKDKTSKVITAQVIKAIKADVLALQEVETLDTLKRFRTSFYGQKSYPYVALVDGNDPRRIDVAVLSKFPITRIRTHQHLWVPSWKHFLFSRDCLEVDVQVAANKTLTLFVNHFKSMMGGRAQTRQKRSRQASEVKNIVKARFGANAGNQSFVILGDFNDYRETAGGATSGIKQLVDWNQVEDIIFRLPAAERWTHFWAKQKEYRQLDYLLLSKKLANATTAVPGILRKGLPTRATGYSGARFSGVGKDSPKASDHCPVYIDLVI